MSFLREFSVRLQKFVHQESAAILWKSPNFIVPCKINLLPLHLKIFKTTVPVFPHNVLNLLPFFILFVDFLKNIFSISQKFFSHGL